MIIGIVRHFPVSYKFPWFCNSRDFNKGMASYDLSEVDLLEDKQTRIEPENWDECFSSRLKRAVITAQYFVEGDFVQTPLLNEVPLAASFSTSLKIPVFLWATIGRILWYFNSKRTQENKRDSHQRARDFLTSLCGSDAKSRKILLFSHGFYTNALKKVLKEWGFKYTPFIRMKHARLYLFKR